MSTNFIPNFATNRQDTGMSVAEEVNRLFRTTRLNSNQPVNIAIATAYINPAGFAQIADELSEANKVRLLLGAEPDQTHARAVLERHADEEQRLQQALDSHEDWLRAERDTSGFRREATQQARALVDWLQSKNDNGEAKVEVRRFSSGFLHGKAYIFDSTTMPAVLAGSSNLTFAGMKLNAELNLGLAITGNPDAHPVIEWFNHYWDRSEPYDLAGLYEHQWEEHSPWIIFLRMLWELYKNHIEEDERSTTHFGLTRFQTDGVARMERLLDTLGGVLVADEVGLGKTYLAGEVIRRTTEELRQRVLIIAPASLKQGMWEPFLDKHAFRRVQVYSYEEVRNRMEPDHPQHTDFVARLDDYSLIVIDEAHNLRNSGTSRAKAIDQVLLSGKHAKKVVLLTATPVNNSLTDLENLLRYFIRDDAHFAAIGIPSIHEYIRHAQSIDPENLTPEHLFDLMDQVAVRRTRKFVKEQYPNEQIVGPAGQPLLIQFPQPKVRRIDYELDPAALTLIDRMLYALDRPADEDLFSSISNRNWDPGRLKLARYTTSAYSKVEDAELFQINNAGLLRSALLKRLESSPDALHRTLEKLIETHQAFLSALDQGYILPGEALRNWSNSESDDLEEFLAQLDDKTSNEVQSAADFYAAELREDVCSDLGLLIDLKKLTAASRLNGDEKSTALLAELSRIAADARREDPRGISSRDRRKVIIFTTFSDTALALHHIVSSAIANAAEGSPLSDYKNRIAPPIMGAYGSVQEAGQSGGVDMGGRAGSVEGFAPETASRLTDNGKPTAEDRFDILITTDVLAEGVNLQQAGNMINYDLPWNPMRIVQRHGRIDRIGSKHDVVHMGLFFPAERLDEMLNLEATLNRKLAQAEAAVGAGQVLPDRRLAQDIILADRESATEQIEELLNTRGNSAALSGEEYRRRLLNAFNNDGILRKEVCSLPFGSGSGLENPLMSKNGYVFCVKIGEHEQPHFRYVPARDDWSLYDEDPYPISTATLECLVASDPLTPTYPRWMTHEVYDRAFDAWQIAKASVFNSWQELTDPNSFLPDTPKSFREASNLVQTSGGYLGSVEQTQLLLKLRSVPSVRIARSVRQILNSDSDIVNKIQRIKECIEDAGIQIPPKIDPLPEITENEVHLIVWMAVKGTK